MKCPSCGAEIDEDAKFCSLCLAPFRRGKPTLEQLTGRASVPSDYSSNTEEPDIERPGKFSGWGARIGLIVICLIVIIPLVIFLPPVISKFIAKINADCIRVDDSTFQKEVLDSSMPVLVIFTVDDLWNRKQLTPAPFGGFYSPASIILALHQIIEGGEYKNSVKFCKYYIQSPRYDDPLCTEYNVKDSTTVIIFKNGEIFWRDVEHKWCPFEEEMVEVYRQKLDGILIEVAGGI
jgi:hypothetical protein